MVHMTLCIIERMVCSTYLMLWEFGTAHDLVNVVWVGC